MIATAHWFHDMQVIDWIQLTWAVAWVIVGAVLGLRYRHRQRALDRRSWVCFNGDMATASEPTTVPAHQLIKGDRINTYRGMATITSEVGHGEGGNVGFDFTPDDDPTLEIYATADPLDTFEVVR